MEVKLKGQDETVTLTEVERDDDHAVIGITNSGKRFAARRDQIEDPDNPEPEVEQDAREIPARHPYRIYLTSGGTLRVLDPSFDEAEAFYLGDNADQFLTVRTADGADVPLPFLAIRSVLSATPDDRRAAGEFLGDEGEDEASSEKVATTL
jgi:hypothetical protein